MRCKIILVILVLVLLYNLIKNQKIEKFSNNDWFNDNIDLYYINLDDSKNRRNSMEKQLSKLNINYNRFSAYNGKLIDKKFSNILINNFNTINYNSHIYKNKKGSLGNYISQLTCWYNFYLKSNKKYLMIMEDDIIIKKNFVNKIQKTIKSVNDDNWSMIKFFCFEKRDGDYYNDYMIKTKTTQQDYKSKKNTGMQCYILNKKKIKDIIEDMLPIENDTFDWKVKYLMLNHKILITNDNFVETPDHNKFSDRKKLDGVKKWMV